MEHKFILLSAAITFGVTQTVSLSDDPDPGRPDPLNGPTTVHVTASGTISTGIQDTILGGAHPVTNPTFVRIKIAPDDGGDNSST